MEPKIIRLRKSIPPIESPIAGLGIKVVTLHKKIREKDIPEEALDPEVWDIPEGYYALEYKED